MSHASVLAAIDCVDPRDRDEIETQVQFQMEPFYENGEWFRDGSRWDWYRIGGRFSGRFAGKDIARLDDLDGVQIKEYRRHELTELYKEAALESKPLRQLRFGVDPEEETLETYLVRKIQHWFPAPYAFLRDRHWHEAERMGWFGSTARTECEIRNPNGSVEEMIRRCVTKCEKTGARVVVWNEPYEIWEQQFFHRFVEPLKSETVLVVVDYHV
jgi:hypothetical protein